MTQPQGRPTQLRGGRAARPRGLLSSPARNLIVGLVYIAIVIAIATASYVVAGWSLADAFFMVISTVFTVGYEVRPVQSPLLRGITTATIIFGCTGVIFLTGALVQFITLNQLNQLFGTKRMLSQIEAMSGHIIICGFGRTGAQLAQELQSGRASFVFVELDDAVAQQARNLGYSCIQADATDEAALQTAGIMRARVLATVVASDAANVFITLSARRLNPGLEIIARGDAPTTESKLLQAGANKVVLPTHIGAERVAEMILYPETARLIRDSARMRDFDKVLTNLGLSMEVMTAAKGSPAEGQTIAALEAEGSGTFFIVQVNPREGDPVIRPEPQTRVSEGDGLVLIGRLLGVRSLFEQGTRAGFRKSVR